MINPPIKDMPEVQIPYWPTQPLVFDTHSHLLRKARVHLFNLELVDEIDLDSDKLSIDYNWEFLRMCFIGMQKNG